MHCDATKKAAVKCIKYKSEAGPFIQSFIDHNETPHFRVHRIRMDNGGEYVSLALQDYLYTKGIYYEYTVPGNSQQNGKSEKYGGNLWLQAEPMLKHLGIPYIYSNWSITN